VVREVGWRVAEPIGIVGRAIEAKCHEEGSEAKRSKGGSDEAERSQTEVISRSAGELVFLRVREAFECRACGYGVCVCGCGVCAGGALTLLSHTELLELYQ